MRYSHDPGGNLIVRAAVAPQIIGQPVAQIAAPGDSASFSVVVGDSDGVTFQWKFNGADIPGATGDSLLLTNVVALNEGIYTVVVTNSAGAFTSAAVGLLIDADSDGLPDSWEIANFGNTTSQRSEGDPDRDGVPNLDEFFDGTDPNNKSSLRPRLRAYSGPGGSITVTPVKSNYDAGESVTLTAAALPVSTFTGWAGDVISLSPTVSLKMDANKTVRARFGSVTPVPSGLFASWRGENDARESVAGRDGTFFSGPAPVGPVIAASGKVGGCFDFDGAVHVRVPDAAAWKLQQISAEAWVFPTAAGGTLQTVIARGSVALANRAWLLGITGRQPVFLWLGNHTAQALPIPVNEWTHLAFSFGGAVARIYVNGELASERSDPGAVLVYDPAPVPLTIGSDWSNNDSASRFIGRIDEVSLYNRVLTGDEIRGIFAADSRGKNFDSPYFTSPAQLPDAGGASPYRHQYSTIFGAVPVTFSLTEGVLPPGLTLTPAGLVSGSTTISGSFPFTVQATDAAGRASEQFCLLRVA